MFVVDSLYCDVNSASAKSFILKAGFIIIIFLSFDNTYTKVTSYVLFKSKCSLHQLNFKKKRTLYCRDCFAYLAKTELIRKIWR